MSFRTRLIIALLLLGSIGAAAIGLIIGYASPSFYDASFPIVAAAMLAVELLIVYFVDKNIGRLSPQNKALTYLGAMVGKMIVALIVLLICRFVEGGAIRSFALCFIALFTWFLMVEAWLFVKIEKNQKTN